MKLAIESEGFGAPSAFIAKFIGGYRSNETDLLRVGCCHFFDLARYLIGELCVSGTDKIFVYKAEKCTQAFPCADDTHHCPSPLTVYHRIFAVRRKSVYRRLFF